ncbi:MAG: tRNA 4-thiouridine(8) synthase ThiI [Clostridia bacterium]|jgi:thiamine biosynthesis protein ThiI|nr:tRNA 4-thiouridine(8) synthase ThiI [Clostridia bacterium]
MRKVIILRYGEIYLKGRNKNFFENLLIKNIKNSLNAIECKVEKIYGRYLITNFKDSDFNKIIDKITKIFGLVSLSFATEIETKKEEIEKLSVKFVEDLLKKNNYTSFKVVAKRADKTFPIHSDKFAAQIGEVILNHFKNLKVELHEPDFELNIEIRENGKTYIFAEKINCCGGMPVGSAGQGLLLLSGGIDSPVAGYLMAKRGLTINAIHFFSFPYTSVAAKEKVIELAKKLTAYAGNIKIFMVPFSKIQEQIHINCSEHYMITIMRRIMMRIAEKICEQNFFKGIITGESLGQVASQTIESITVINNALKTIPVLRPVIALDKFEIVNIAKEINTYNISILPYEDCCTAFLPKNPVIKPTIVEAEKQENYLQMDKLINEAIEAIEIIQLRTDEK